MSPPLRGDVWYRDALAIDRADVVDGIARFHLAPDGGARTLPIVVAVGTDTTIVGPALPASAVIMRDVKVPGQSGLVYQVTLRDAMPLDPATWRSGRPGQHVLVWAKTSPQSSCLAIADGDTAAVKFAKMARGCYSTEECEAIRRDLLTYCERDTLAMVEMHRALLQQC